MEPTIAGELESPAVVDDAEPNAGTDGGTVHAESDGEQTPGAGGTDEEPEPELDSDQSDAEESTVYAAPPAHSKYSPEPVGPEEDGARAETDRESRTETPETDTTGGDSSDGSGEAPGNTTDSETSTGEVVDAEADPSFEELSYAEGESHTGDTGDTIDGVDIEVKTGDKTGLEGSDESDGTLEDIDEANDDTVAEESAHDPARGWERSTSKRRSTRNSIRRCRSMTLSRG
ncbi:hypothetical protein [Natronosalvus vescus]|uniref:hypothetical protein n=1 Tax=Natronosalvus vescus TaxID=2953881 RepID=UPI00209009CD|nr:hypothetical protein [Natronosalvus vescus]